MIEQLEKVTDSYKQFSHDIEKTYKAIADAKVIARGYITTLDLESALRDCGIFEFKRKRKLRQAIADVKGIVDGYKKLGCKISDFK